MKKLLISIVLVTFGFTLGYYAGGHSSGLPRTAKPEQAGKVQLGPWVASSHIPGSLQMPDKSPLIRCEFQSIRFGSIHLTVTNLVGRSYLVRYNIYGYNVKGRRVSDGYDEFAIGGQESVVRKVILNTYADPLAGGFQKQQLFGQTFSVQMTLEE